MQMHYVYLPGLGDGFFNHLRRVMLIGWRLRGLSVSFIDLNWGDRDELDVAKFRRALEHVVKYDDQPVTLIGESAGGSMALRLFLDSNAKIKRVYTICGYNNGAKQLDSSHREANPAFIPTVSRVDQLLDGIGPAKASAVTTYYSPSDDVVAYARTEIAGGRAVKLPHLSHVAAIGYFLLRTSIKGIG